MKNVTDVMIEKARGAGDAAINVPVSKDFLREVKLSAAAGAETIRDYVVKALLLRARSAEKHNGRKPRK